MSIHQNKYAFSFDNSFTIEKIDETKEIIKHGKPKALITGYTIVDGIVALEQGKNAKMSLQFQKNILKYFILYPEYIEFLEEPERWNQPTVDGTVEKEACVKWMEKYLDIEEKKEYSWGKVEVIYEQWIGKAAIMYQFF